MGVSIFYTIVGAIIGGLVTFYFTRKKFEKEIKESEYNANIQYYEVALTTKLNRIQIQ